MSQVKDSNPGDKVKVFNLDSIEMLWLEARKRKARHEDDSRWLEEFKELLKEKSGFADEFLLNGRKEAVLRPGNLNRTRIAAEQPQVIEMYTRIKTKLEFDADAFRVAEPELFEKYRAKALVFVDSEPSFEGLS